jgi:protein CpxP
MFNKKRMIAAGAALALAVSITAVLAQSTKGHYGHRGGMGRVFSQLGLTDAQKTQLKQVRSNHKAALSDLRGQIRAKMQTVRQGEQSGAFDEQAATQALTDTAPLKAKLMSEEFKMRQEMLAVLTPDQKAKLDQMRQQWKSGAAQRHAQKG